VVFTTTVKADVTPTTALPSRVTYANGEFEAFLTRHLVPADSEGFTVTVEVQPSTSSTGLAAAPPAPGYTRLLEGSIGSFVSQYLPDRPRSVQDIALAGPLDIGPHHGTFDTFLPAITKNYGGWWPHSLS